MQVTASQHLVAQLGVSIEPLASIPQTQTVPDDQKTQNVAGKLLENFYNYCMSFCQPQPHDAMVFQAMQSAQGQDKVFVPFKVLTDWYNNMKRKIELDPHYFTK